MDHHHRPNDGPRKKRVTDLFWWLDCTRLARDGLFAYPGKQGQISWTIPSSVGSIHADYLFAQYESEGPTLRLVIPAGSANPPITIKLATTDVHFGGRRFWFLCPRCGRRAGILYGDELAGPFHCRLCLSLAYQSQLFHERKRAWWAALKVRERFDGSSIGSPFPPRLRGMHWETYFRLWDKHSKAMKVFHASFRAELERMNRSLERAREKAIRKGWISE